MRRVTPHALHHFRNITPNFCIRFEYTLDKGQSITYGIYRRTEYGFQSFRILRNRLVIVLPEYVLLTNVETHQAHHQKLQTQRVSAKHTPKNAVVESPNRPHTNRQYGNQFRFEVRIGNVPSRRQERHREVDDLFLACIFNPRRFVLHH